MDRGWQVVFAVGPAACSTVPALTTSGCRCIALPGSDHDEPAVLGEIAGGRAELFIIDHYGRAATFERECRALAQQVVVFDDGTGRDHDCDLLIDAAGDPSCYAPHVPHGARLATGPSFALVRQDFVAHRETSLSRRDGRPVRRILVSFGLADTANATGIALDALASAVGEATIDVVISSRAVHFNDIMRRAGERVRVIVDPVDMPGLMTQADLAVGAAGASAYERAALGLPSIIVATADNQLGVCRLMAEAGAAIYVGNSSARSCERSCSSGRGTCCKSGRALEDEPSCRPSCGWPRFYAVGSSCSRANKNGSWRACSLAARRARR